MIQSSTAINGFIQMCNDGWNMGWHERNGGNLTYRMSENEVVAVKNSLSPSTDWIDIGIVAENMANEHFITTGTGKYFRNVILDPAANIGIVEISPCGGKYRIVWGLENGARPTSEFPSHVMNHSVRAEVTGGTSRVIYHAHPVNIIALTFALPLTTRDFSRVLWSNMPECSIVFPAGVGVMPYMVPGGAEIARESCKLMKTFESIVWAHHGLFCAGETFDSAFGLMHTIEKSAEIYIRALSCGQGIKQTLTAQNLREIAKAYNVPLNAELLGEE